MDQLLINLNWLTILTSLHVYLTASNFQPGLFFPLEVVRVGLDIYKVGREDLLGVEVDRSIIRS